LFALALSTADDVALTSSAFGVSLLEPFVSSCKGPLFLGIVSSFGGVSFVVLFSLLFDESVLIVIRLELLVLLLLFFVRNINTPFPSLIPFLYLVKGDVGIKR
jgi:hypothetical protein